MTINSDIIGSILVGPSYNIGGIIFLVLALYYIFYRSTENFIALLNNLGLPKKSLLGEIFRLILHLSIAILLVPFGVICITIALVISEFSTGFLMFWVFRKESPVPIKDYFRTCLFIGLLLIIMSMSLLLPSTLEFLIIYNIFFFFLCYIGFNIFRPLKKTELQLLDQILPKKVMKLFYHFTSYSPNTNSNIKI